MENLVGLWRSFLLGGCKIGTHWRLESVVKIELWMVAGDIAQDHEEGVTGKLPGLGLEALSPPLLMHFQLLNQLIEEDSQLNAWDLLLANREDWAIHAHHRSLSTETLGHVDQALDLEVAQIDLILQLVLGILRETLGAVQILGQQLLAGLK